MATITKLTPPGGINLSRAPLILRQLALVEETIDSQERKYPLNYTGIDLRNATPVIIIDRPASPLTTFPEGHTLVRPQPDAPLCGQVKKGGCYLRWEDEQL